MPKIHFVYDVYCNWADGIGKSYLIPKYHEWYPEDEVEFFNCMPVVLVSKDVFTFIEEDYNVIPKEILSLVAGKASQKVDGITLPANYTFIVTDGTRTLAVDTDDEDVPNYKSYLSPRDIGKVENILPKIMKTDVTFVKPEPNVLNKTDQLSADLLLLDEKYIVGLTRAERDMKAILMTYLYTLVTSTNNEEVRYWYSEVFPGTFNSAKVKRMRKETLVRQMFEELKEGWDKRHVNLGDEIIKHNDMMADSWKLLRKKEKEKVNN